MRTIISLWRVARFSPLLLLAVNLAFAVYFCLPLLAAVLTGRLFDSLAGNATSGLNPWAIMALIAVAESIRILTQVGFQKFCANFCAIVEAHLRTNMLRGILAGRPDRLSLSPGEAVSRFDGDIVKILDTFDTEIDTVGITAYILLSSAVLFSIDRRLTLILLGLGLVMVLVSRTLYRSVARHYAAAREAAERVSGFIGEASGAILALKVAQTEDRTASRFAALNDQRQKAEVRSAMTQILADTLVSTTVTNLGTGLLLLLAIGSIQSGTLTVGEFTLFVLTAPRLTGYLRRLGQGLVYLWQSGISLTRMAELIDGSEADLTARGPIYLRGDLPDVACEPLESPLDVLTVRGLAYTYPGGRRGVEGIDLDIRRGELIAVTGGVGSGKSTLLKALLGLVTPSAGEVRWNDTLVDPTAFLQPPHVAYTPQAPRLFSGTIRENILMGLREGSVDLTKAVGDSALEADLATMAEGLDTIIGSRGVRLSGGQAQRVAAARMIVRRPELLIFDDLSSALDVETEETLWNRIRDNAGTTCLAVSHRRAVLTRADRVVVLSEGRVVAVGTSAELLRTSPEFQRLWADEHAAAGSD